MILRNRGHSLLGVPIYPKKPPLVCLTGCMNAMTFIIFWFNNEWAHVSITYNAARKRELRSEQNIQVMSTCKTLVIVAIDMMYTEWQLAHKNHLLGHAQHVYSGALLKIQFDTTLNYHFEVRYIWRPHMYSVHTKFNGFKFMFIFE